MHVPTATGRFAAERLIDPPAGFRHGLPPDLDPLERYRWPSKADVLAHIAKLNRFMPRTK